MWVSGCGEHAHGVFPLDGWRGDQLHYWEMLLFYMLIDGGLIALRSLADRFGRHHDSNGRQEFIGFCGSGSCSLAHEGCFVSTAARRGERLKRDGCSN